jgi:hypothetical protein
MPALDLCSNPCTCRAFGGSGWRPALEGLKERSLAPEVAAEATCIFTETCIGVQ